MTASAVLSSIALKKVIKAPSAVANTLDWRKASGGVATALAIDVHADKIGLALATLRSENDDEGTHTESMLRSGQLFPNRCDLNRDQFSLGFHDSFSCRVLDPIPLIASGETIQTGRKRKRVICPQAKRRLSGLVRDHKVCGFVVSWPVQQDTGLIGASCGRTLWALEQLLQEDETDAPPFAPNRPVCLWKRVQIDTDAEHLSADAFGRCSMYARTSDKTEHFASKEQYHLEDEDEPILAADVLRDFCQHHWPAAEAVTIPIGSGGVKDSGPSQVTLVESRYSTDCLSSRRRSLVAA